MQTDKLKKKKKYIFDVQKLLRSPRRNTQHPYKSLEALRSEIKLLQYLLYNLPIKILIWGNETNQLNNLRAQLS